MSFRTLAAVLPTLLWCVPAAAAPVSGSFTLAVTIKGLPTLTVGSTGTIDVTGGIVTVPAGLVSQGGSLVVPVTATTAIDSVGLSGLANLSGVFSVGGITSQAPTEICPGGGPGFGAACNVGGNLGGLMGLTGSIEVNVLPTVVVLPIQLGDTQIGLGGASNTPFIYDAAGWTSGTGLVNTGNLLSTHGSSGVDSFSLVTPLFVSACGNLLPIFASLTASGLAEVPEPAAWASLWLGVLGLVVLTRRRR